MTVFKGYMTIIKRNLGFMFMYMGIFLTIQFLVQGMAGDSAETMYQASSLKIAVIDEDNSFISQGIIQVLSQRNEVMTDITDPKVLVEEMHYEALDYVLQIPPNAGELLLEEGATLNVTKNPEAGGYSGIYADMQIDTFLNIYRVYRNTGADEEMAVKKALSVMEETTQVELRDSASHREGGVFYHFYYRFLPFVLISTFCYVLALGLRSFNQKNIERRMNSSGISSFRQSIQGAFALFLFCGGFYLLLMIIPFILYGSELIQDKHFGYYILNSGCLALVSASLAYLIGNIVKNDAALSGIANIMGLGMSFLCGVFVDMSILGKGVKMAAHFLPVYWYETANITLYEYGTLTKEQMNSVWMSFGIQVAMAIACLCITFVIKKKRVNEG